MKANAPLTPPIIRLPERQTQTQRLVGRTLTLLFWLFWVYLWLPLISLVAWWLGFERAYEALVTHKGFARLVEMLPVMGAGVVLLVGGLLVWAAYNYLKFHHRHRRTHHPALPLTVMAATSGLAAATLSEAQTSRKLLVLHDVEGRPLVFNPLPPASPLKKDEA